MKLFSRKSFLISAALSLLGLLAPDSARGQVTYTTPQTVQLQLASSLACTGSAQNFDTGSVTNFDNLGQTQHFATVKSTGATQLKMEIDGIDASGNLTRISDVLDSSINLATGSSIQGSGYFPKIRVSVTCSPGTATFSVNYSGSSSTPLLNAGGYQLAQLDKASFSGSAANTNQSDNFQPPFGNTAGTIAFDYQTAAVAGSTLTVACANISFTFNVPNVANTSMIFQVPPGPCTSLTLNYTSGGATAGTILVDYVFQNPGQPSLVNPCNNPAVPQQSAPISLTASGIVVTGVTTNSIWPCGGSFTISGSATATAQLASGTGAACGTGTTNLSGTYLGGTVPVPIIFTGGFKLAAPNSFCILLGGATPSVQGILTFVQNGNFGL